MSDFYQYDPSIESKVLVFTDTPAGQEEKLEILRALVGAGWTIVSETKTRVQVPGLDTRSTSMILRVD